MKRWRRRRREPTAPCPIRALVDQLVREGWTVVMPFPIPEACHGRWCGHLPLDVWARDYARQARRLVDGIESGRYTREDADRLAATFEWEAS